MDQSAPGQLEILLVHSENKIATMEILSAACQAWKEHYPDRELRMNAVNETSRKLIQKVLPVYRIIGKKYVASWNYL